MIAHPTALPVRPTAADVSPRWHAGLFQHIGPKDRAKLWIGRLLFPAASARWWAVVQGNEILRAQIAAFPSLATKIYRPYLTRPLGCAQRVEALAHHYRFMVERGLADLVQRAAAADVLLAELPCKSGALAQISLSAIHEGHREGELCLKLRYGGEQLYAASLVLLQDGGRPQLMLGRLQGTACEQGRTLVREATRDLFACRPGALLVNLARHIAHRLGCAHMRLVSNENRIAINLWRRWRISADYDRLWLELGALRAHDGDFRIDSLAAPAVDIAATASKKRGEARRKLAMLEALYTTVGEHFVGTACQEHGLPEKGS